MNVRFQLPKRFDRHIHAGQHTIRLGEERPPGPLIRANRGLSGDVSRPDVFGECTPDAVAILVREQGAHRIRRR